MVQVNKIIVLNKCLDSLSKMKNYYQLYWALSVVWCN